MTTLNGPGEPPHTGAGSEAASLRELLLQTGVEIIELEGLALAADTISYANVFNYLQDAYSIRVTRGSVHERIWASHKDFRREVLAEAVKYLPRRSQNPRSALTVIRSTDGPESSSPTAPDPVARFCRLIGHQLFSQAIDSRACRQMQSAKAIASRFNDPLGVEILHGEIGRRMDEILADRRTKFPVVLAWLGLRPRAALGLTDDQCSDLHHTITNAMFGGCHLNYHAGFAEVAEPLSYQSVPADADPPWLNPSIGLKAMLDFLYETDPDGPTERAIPELMKSELSPIVADPGRSSADRRPRQELKRLVLAAAVELLLRDGLDPKSGSLGYAAVFARIKQTHGITVHRSSVHNRFWSSHEEFQSAVLTRAILTDRYPDESVEEMFSAIPTTPPGSGDPSSRRQLALDTLRIVTAQQAEALTRSRSFKQRLLIKAALLAGSEAATMAGLRAAINQTDRQRLDRQKALFTASVLDLGFEVRPETGFTIAGATEVLLLLTVNTTTGLIFDHLAGSDLATQTFRLPRFDDPMRLEEWTSAAVVSRALFELLFRDPDQD